MTNQIKALSIRELFSNGTYSIPIYQRNYAWSMDQVEQLIQDVANAARNGQNNYYIGNLIVDRHPEEEFETIDGQQRMTTLFIILCALRTVGVLSDEVCFDHRRLDFEHRENSRESLRRVYNGEMKELDQKEVEENNVELHILDIFRSTYKVIGRLCREAGVAIEKFTGYLLDKVIILRIEVPKGIDKNPYFEVMNSRGVQLEQHEIVKARLMDKLSHGDDAQAEADRNAFEVIWEACSNMDRFVQMNFSPDCRKHLFGEDWTNFPACGFAETSEAFKAISKDNDVEQKSLLSLINDFNSGSPSYAKIAGKEKTLADDQFHSIINFPGLLLHVLKILRPAAEVPLYDKWLVETFDKVMQKEDDHCRFAMEYAICLLKCRYLLDKYVIKRNKDDIWGIFGMATTMHNNTRHAYPKNTFGREDIIDSGNELVMILSMFHFSTPSTNYKNWLNGTLAYLYHASAAGEITMEGYLSHMKSLANAFVTDWYLCPAENKPVDFMTMIHVNKGVPQRSLENVNDEALKGILNRGTDVDSFIFNYYDYLIWKECGGEKDFRFGYRTSVEHFYPQNPTGGYPMDSEYLHSFGNLCLISTSMNSKFTNKLPVAKYAEYGDNEKARGLSLKLQEMFDVVKENKFNEDKNRQEWYIDEIRVAESKAIERFRNHLKIIDQQHQLRQ